ncbi:hypothetical protein KSP39_PZI003052 [Platanthera zijinensis]|uniref:Uncharacterized protein n=1 Tax=Platanthera zijinensis TaxID=2320716 RepID=A0AAP0BY77_9ASPA
MRIEPAGYRKKGYYGLAGPVGRLIDSSLSRLQTCSAVSSPPVALRVISLFSTGRQLRSNSCLSPISPQTRTVARAVFGDCTSAAFASPNP